MGRRVGFGLPSGLFRLSTLSPMHLPFLFLGLLLPGLALAGNIYEEANKPQYNTHYLEQEEAPWEEVQTTLPPAPKPEHLTAIDVGAGARFSYLVDLNSVEAGQDGVVRYSLLARSPSGAENLTFEGLRCATGEHKLYAFGRKTGEWSKNSRAQWTQIRARTLHNPQSALFFHYICPVLDKPRDTATVKQLIRSGGLFIRE